LDEAGAAITMSNREALRELQSRLADRLQAVGPDANAASWLAFECHDQGFIVPLPTAGEIFPLAPLTPLAHTAGWFLGVANLRGQLHGVVDLAAYLGLRSALRVEQMAEQQRSPARLLAFNPVLGSHCAVLIDRLAGLRSAHQMEPDQGDTSAKPDFALAVWHDADGRAWQEIDLGLLARHEQYLAIAA
jgi:twitching motility protein PilI